MPWATASSRRPANRRGIAGPDPNRLKLPSGRNDDFDVIVQDTHRLYCDEAGNTGANYNDRAQPVMVFASWLVPLDSEDAVVATIDGLASRSNAAELHASRMLRRRTGWPLARDLVTAVKEAGAIPFFYLVEKRYQLAERIVHALLDRHTNPRAEGAPSIGNPGYLELIEFLYNIPERSAVAYARAIAAPTEASLRSGITAVAAGVRTLGESGIAHMIEGCLKNLQEVIDYDFSDRGGHKHSQVTSPHLPGTMRMLEAADAFAEAQGYGLISVFHDETNQYGEVLRQWVGHMTKIGEHGKKLTPVPDFPSIGFAHLHDFATATSHSSRCIQLADVLATSLAQLARTTLAGRPWSVEGREIANLILGPLLTNNLEHGGISVSAPLREAMRARVVTLAST